MKKLILEDPNCLASFVKLHSRLIQLEFEEEKKTFNYSLKSPDMVHLKQRGLLIDNLSVNEIEYEFGSCIVEFRRGSSSKRYCPLLISSGDMVGVWCVDEGEKNYIGIGTVMVVGQRIRISMDEKCASDIHTDLVYFMVKTSSEVTYKRMKRALENLSEYENTNSTCHMILQHLFHCVPLESDPALKNFFDGDKFKFINYALHDDQKAAVLFALQQKHLAIIHGPPGTGKTTTLVEIISQLVGMKQRALVCAPSNIAVDNILEKLSTIENRVIRLGKPARMMESIRNYSLDAAMLTRDDLSILNDIKRKITVCQDNLKEVPQAERPLARGFIRTLRKEVFTREEKAQRELLLGSSVVLATLTSVNEEGAIKHLPDQFFDVVIIDECSQAIEAACWIAIPKASKLILAGDHMQLPPTVKSKEAMDQGLSVSLMERAIKLLGKDSYKLLTQQFRMHSSIMSWVTKMYDNVLKADDSVATRLLKDLPGVAETEETESPLCFIDTAGCKFAESEFQGSRCNESEADLVCVLIKRLLDAGVDENIVSVITPYSLQVSCINMKLKYPEVEVRTVDGFQGREKEAVIISLVRSNKEKELGFVADKRRLNVAVSRAKRFLAIVADSSTVGGDLYIKGLLKHIQKNGTVISGHEFSSEILEEKLPSFMSTVIVKTEATSKKKSEGSGSKSESKPNTSSKGSKHKQPPPAIGNKSEGAAQQSGTAQLEGNTVPTQRRKQAYKDLKSLDIMFSRLHCSDSEEEPMEVKDEVSGNKSVGATQKSVRSQITSSKLEKTNLKKNKNSKTQVLEAEGSCSGDDDCKFLDKVIQMNSICGMKNCQTSVKLISHFCEYCGTKYCLSHMLPEVHGCGEEVRRATRHNFKHQVTKPSAKEKKIAAMKLQKKVSELAAERKAKVTKSKKKS